MKKSKEAHIPVLLDETLALFEGKALKTFFEGTLGLGGHAEAILTAHPEIEQYFACDQDINAIERSKNRLAPWNDKIEYIHDSFSNLDELLKQRGCEQIDGFFLT